MKKLRHWCIASILGCCALLVVSPVLAGPPAPDENISAFTLELSDPMPSVEATYSFAVTLENKLKAGSNIQVALLDSDHQATTAFDLSSATLTLKTLSPDAVYSDISNGNSNFQISFPTGVGAGSHEFDLSGITNPATEGNYNCVITTQGLGNAAFTPFKFTIGQPAAEVNNISAVTAAPESDLAGAATTYDVTFQVKENATLSSGEEIYFFWGGQQIAPGESTAVLSEAELVADFTATLEAVGDASAVGKITLGQELKPGADIPFTLTNVKNPFAGDWLFVMTSITLAPGVDTIASESFTLVAAETSPGQLDKIKKKKVKKVNKKKWPVIIKFKKAVKEYSAGTKYRVKLLKYNKKTKKFKKIKIFKNVKKKAGLRLGSKYLERGKKYAVQLTACEDGVCGEWSKMIKFKTKKKKK